MKRHWLGFWTSNSYTGGEPLYYGPTAFNFFVHRVCSHLESTINQPQLGEVLRAGLHHHQSPKPSTQFQAEEPLTRHGEQALLNLFWQSYHSIFPILDEDELRNHYNSLWPVSFSVEQARRPSALVDIILALCMQYSAAGAGSGATLYEGCQTRLISDGTGPSISALQCYIYQTIYLINTASFIKAHTALSIAVQIAYALGVHHEAPTWMQDSQRYLRRRLWSVLFQLDTTLALTLGRPNLIRPSDSTLDLVETDEAMAATSSTAAVYEGITWEKYHVHAVKMCLLIRDISVSFEQICTKVMTMNSYASIYANPALLETCASSLRQSIVSLQTWVDSVPPLLRLRRKDAGAVFSARRSQIDFDTLAPLWLQRQRVLLELFYHDTLQCLYRTFIRYPSSDGGPELLGPNITTISDSNAVSALNHAIATIHMVHQTLTETDLFNTWHRAYHYLWEATVTVIGFTLARPLCPFTISAKKAIEAAIMSFDIFASNGMTTAPKAARVIRELSATAIGGSQASDTPTQDQTFTTPQIARRTSNVFGVTPPQLRSPANSSTSGNQSLPFQLNNVMNPMVMFDANQQQMDGLSVSFPTSVSPRAPMAVDIMADVMNLDLQNIEGWDPNLGAWYGDVAQG
jgi:hypothetical protein